MSESPGFEPLLQALNQIQAIDEDQWQRIKPAFKYRELQSNQHFLQLGDPVTECAFVISGLLRIYYLNSEGKEVNRGFALENTFCGRFPMGGMPSNISIQALEPSRVLVGQLSQMRQLDYYQSVQTKILTQVLGYRENREQLMLLESAEARYRHFIEHKPILLSRLPQAHIASYLGIAPATFSRLKKKMQLS